MIYQFCCYCKLYNSIFISFLVYRKTINFCILTLYSVTMLCLFIYFLGSILWDFLHRQSHHLWTQTFFYFPVFEENIVFLILKHILTAFYTNGSMWHQGRLIFCHLLGLVLRTEIKALMKGEVWKVAFLRDQPYNGVISMFSLKFYLGSNRETSRGLQAMGVFLFTWLIVGIVFWNPGLQIITNFLGRENPKGQAPQWGGALLLLSSCFADCLWSSPPTGPFPLAAWSVSTLQSSVLVLLVGLLSWCTDQLTCCHSFTLLSIEKA